MALGEPGDGWEALDLSALPSSPDGWGRRRRRDASGYTEAEAAYDAARERDRVSLERIAAIRAKTPRGAALKAAVVAGSYEDDPEELEAEIRREDYGLDVRLALSIARDLSQMAGAPVS